ncbi:protoporphyrinogen oxidase [Caldinitratiruptor microaerophilus]|uniref:Coproporphyrinogen III oxidase n=1 Tax=Caldinitratiruptor microaerophilus TaxID=671077 RepID=A0AA35CQH7_9FIRM|nr:protoporphyrinogen oxidase [Caldinitratiruptor microaerophilus]BDG62307.1 protoporphyrinogen oxidase [Caldinitratiruptor microaerophilus]
MRRKHVVVVGGGITGLAAAYRLQERAREAGLAVDWTLVERESRLGGKIVTEVVDDFIVDGGPDSFLSEKPGVIDLARRVGAAGRLLPTNESERGTFIYSRGRLHRLPDGLLMMVPTRLWPMVATGLLSWPGKLRMAMDLFIPPRRDRADESLESFVVRRLGREALERIAEPLVAGIHASEPSRMSVRASFPRFVRMEEEHGSLIRAALAARRRAAAAAPGGGAGDLPVPRTYFMSFRGGMGDLTASVAARLDPGRVVLGRGVSEIAPGRDGAPYAVFLEGGGRLEADAVILATPSVDTARLLEGVDPEIAGLVGQIPMAPAITVSLAWRRADLPPGLEGFGFLVPAVERRRLMGVTYSSVKWEGRAPDGKHFLLRAFLGGPRDRGLVQAPDAHVVRIVRQELKEIAGIAAEPIFARVYRWEHGIHQYTLGHLERVAAIEGALARLPGLFLAGGAYHGIGIPDCIRSGEGAAEAALAFVRA